jgi:hypothetical protein
LLTELLIRRQSAKTVLPGKQTEDYFGRNCQNRMTMMEGVVTEGGTGTAASVDGLSRERQAQLKRLILSQRDIRWISGQRLLPDLCRQTSPGWR